MNNLLNQMGWTQAHFAEVLGVDKKTVYNWCRDNKSSPGYNSATKYLELMLRVKGL